MINSGPIQLTKISTWFFNKCLFFELIRNPIYRSNFSMTPESTWEWWNISCDPNILPNKKNSPQYLEKKPLLYQKWEKEHYKSALMFKTLHPISWGGGLENFPESASREYSSDFFPICSKHLQQKSESNSGDLRHPEQTIQQKKWKYSHGESIIITITRKDRDTNWFINSSLKVITTREAIPFDLVPPP